MLSAEEKKTIDVQKNVVFVLQISFCEYDVLFIGIT